jgi:hypothetical protein
MLYMLIREEACWGEGKDATLRYSLRLSRCTNGSKTTGEVHPLSSAEEQLQLRALRIKNHNL